MFRTFATAAILALTIGAAQAGPLTVQFGDLNPSNPGDAHILASRVQTASEAVCAEWKPDRWQRDSYFVNLFYKNIYDSCVDTTSHRVISRAMDKAQDRAAELARN